MRIRRLQQLILKALKPIKITALSPTMNLAEDISCGAAQISHLLVEKRLCFDERLKNYGLFNAETFDKTSGGNNGVFSKPAYMDYEVTCTEEYKKNRMEKCWKFEGNLDRMKERRKIYDSSNRTI